MKNFEEYLKTRKKSANTISAYIGSESNNGLGLAIAKSYTELCNGTLDIILDGDLFKAFLKFKKY